MEAITGRSPEAFYAAPELTRASLHPDDVELFNRMVSDPAASPAADGEALIGVAERLRRMRCMPAGGSKHQARVAVGQTRPFGDAR